MKKPEIFKLSSLSLAILASMTTPTIAAEDSQKIEKIMVTGSRIARAEVESTSPITVVSKEDLTNLGISDVSSALRRLPALTGRTANNQSSAGSNNIQTATLRGIEATNTLVLLNGRRLVGSDEDGLVDLSSIPFEAIQQIEVLKDGASAIYGSDAIAGVVNIITSRGYDGFKITGHYGRSSRGDADERKVGFVTGISTDKASILIAASTSNNNGWEEKDRYMTKDADQSYLGGGNGRSGTAPNPKLTGFGLGDGTWTVPDAANPSQAIAWDYTKEGYNYREAQSGANDNKTTSVYAFVDYQLSDNVTFFSELSFHDGFVQGNQAPPGTDTGWYSTNVDTPNAFKRYPDADGNHFGVGAQQKYNPFGIAGNVAKRFSEYGSRIYKSNNTIQRYTFGLQGMVAEDYDWELVYSSQSAKLVQEGGPQPSLIQIERALSNECETAADPDCVALNVFGPEGSVTPQMLDFINTTAPSRTNKNDLSFIQASIAGPVMQLPAGEMMFSAGAEYREDQLSLTVDQAQRTATFDVSWGGSVTPVVSPVREITEYYMELAIPVFEDLNLEAAVRYSDYSDIDQTTTNPKFGIIYQPIESLKLRGSYSTGFRAPTMAEMYQGRTSSINTNIYDPCNPNNDSNYVNTSIAGCANLNPAFSKNEIQSNDIIGGGNLALKPEESDNMTLGLVLAPLDDLSITLDYFEIEQSNVVFSSSRYVVDQFVSGNPEFANAVIRSNNGTGYIQTIYSSSNNIASRNLSGFDLNMNYLLENNLGTWRFNLDATYMNEFQVQDTSDTAFRDVVGMYDSAFGSIPEYKVNTQVDWSIDNYRITWDATYNSKIEAASDDIMDSTLFHNLQAGYYVDNLDVDIHFGVHNLFDKNPPFLKANGTSTDDNLYSFRGRFYYMGFSKTFN
ncbi:TonB-dependent receptor [Pseudoalteromonas sp. MMG012]|uniref:TonB-dependent receptor n=1 Tax=Pseudoalteromonas sp. MMG012 TaxID=2822686 RepID=UPI001B3A6C75|nr:TonB-dependent receptor [Pseudoalteromonas sp. MMG012]MBQ4851780.1 TonB-dependent receptor [Pseudoalteromonas sp. MMG012]